ncbi:MAG: hypothetical protein NC419_06080 [Muribaculaceae bacterium]|nr:hypothetical protein [Muribaculaceae bacterium]
MDILIVIIIVGVVMYRAYHQKGNSDAAKKSASAPPDTNTAPVRHRAESSGRQPYGTNRQSMSGQPANKTSMPGQSLTGQSTWGQFQDEPEEQEHSTLAYLDEKARQDALEHERERREEAERLNRNYGGFRVAERLFDGDTVPNGKRCSVCGYCGAENLVPMMAREKYSCYFCRELLS